MPGLLIHDGYTLTDTIPAKHGFPEIVFQYRPALPEQMNDWRTANATNGKEVTKAIIVLLEKTMVAWNLTEEAGILKKILGNPENLKGTDDNEMVSVPIVANTLRAVPDIILRQLFDIVAGYGPEKQGADVKN